ncbi:MAG: hypothetical protein ACE14M_00295 [Terriglobales bacterium]
MNYLLASEYEAYGLEPTVAASWIAAASALIDAHCRRPSLGVAQYSERVRLSSGRQTVRLSYLPLAVVSPATTPLISLRGRYAVPRRGDAACSAARLKLAQDVALAFALPGTWVTLDVNAVDFCAETGELTFPPNPLGLTFNEVEVTYNAGLASIPDAVKFACVQIVRNAQSTPALNVRSGALDRMHLEYFADTLLDSNVRALLASCVAQKVG